MDQLGHSDPAVTLRIYAHLLKRRRTSGARIDALLMHRGDDHIITA